MVVIVFSFVNISKMMVEVGSLAGKIVSEMTYDCVRLSVKVG